MTPSAEATRLHLLGLALRQPGHALRLGVLQGLGWDLGTDVVAGRGLQLTGLRPATVGSRVNLGPHALLDVRGGLRIGSDVDLAGDTAIWTADHRPDDPRHGYRERPVTIGNRVWIGYAAILLPGSVIGDNVVVGAGAVVAGRLEPDGIYAGNPAVLIRRRDPGAMQRLNVWRQPWL